jgi:hypothetical protein
MPSLADEVVFQHCLVFESYISEFSFQLTMINDEQVSYFFPARYKINIFPKQELYCRPS